MSEKSDLLKEISELTKKRSSYKGQITIFIGYLSSFETSSPPEQWDFGELELRIRKLDSLYAKFDDVQTRLECISEDVEQTLEERDEFESRYYKTLSKANNILSNYKKSHIPLPSGADCGAISHSGRLNPVKLPTLEIPKFNGEFRDWLEFRDTFMSLIHSNDDIDNINKFHYLRSSLEGSAALIISSVQISANNYKVAWQMLCDRFNNKRLLIQHHVSALFSIESVTREMASNLKNIIDQLNKNLRALETLGEPTKHWDTLLIYIMSHKLDSKSFREWEEYKGRLNTDTSIELQYFLEFLRMRVTILDTIEFNKSSHNTNNNITIKSPKLKSMAVQNKTQVTKVVCPKCLGEHKLGTCPQFLSLSNEDRLKLIPSFKVCFNCFSTSHFSNTCRKQGCKVCKKKHSTLIHVDRLHTAVHSERTDSDSAAPSSRDHSNLTLSTSVSNAKPRAVMESSDVILSTALVKLHDVNNRAFIVRVVLDSGSTSCLMSNEMFSQLKLPFININQSVQGINNSITQIDKLCKLRINSLDGKFTRSINCFILPTLTDHVPSRTINIAELNIPTNICLADPHFYKPASVDLILGADIFWDIICSQKIKLGENKPILCETRLGWIISGPLNNTFSDSPKSIKCNFLNSNHLDSDISITNQVIQKQLTRFWNLEEVLSTSSCLSPEQKLCEEHFTKNTTRLADGRFCVRIPLKENPSVLGDSFQRAKQCLLSLECRLSKNLKLYEMYREFMAEYQSLGHMSECNSKPNAHFIPHHGVLRESSTTTKLRVVFNASSPTTNNNSLNSIQMVGPTVQDDILSILLRFRQHKYVILADVEKMYRQIIVHPDDQFLQHILWRDNPAEPIREFELHTVTYGTASAPYLATRCLKQLGLECEDKNIANIILHDFYVDDLLSGEDDVDTVRDIRNKISNILASAGLLLRKWKSNEPQLVSDSNPTSHDLNIGGAEPNKTLGLGWLPESDELYFSINNISLSNQIKITKRDILSIISSIYDPCGLLSIFVIKFKIILQRLWLKNLSWDDYLPSDIHAAWLDTIKNLNILNNLRIPRRVIIDSYSQLEIHVFSDASERAYGACLYVRSIDRNSNVLVRLLFAKSRVAPLKPTTIPRLELCGAQVAAKLYEKVCNSLRVTITKAIFWTDSTIVLGWLKMLPSKLNTFVRNRVGDILDKTGNCEWRHIPSELNPADLLSRGVCLENLESINMWWSGPQFLTSNQNDWPTTSLQLNTLPELRKDVTLLNINNKLSTNVINFERFSNFNRLRRCIAYVIRFIQTCRGNRFENKFLSDSELTHSLNNIIRIVQSESFPEYNLLVQNKSLPSKNPLLKFNVFLDNNKLMRVGGRINNSDFSYDKKHPIILQSTHRFTKLLFQYEHMKLLHAGPQLLLASIREVYWPIGGRNLARSTFRQCIKCARMKGKIEAPIMGNLPKQRLTPGYPFESVGVDYAGPISSLSRQGRGSRIVKVYIVIFVCFTTKAIHLELVGDLSSNSYIQTLRRFVARRGKPRYLYSDNGTMFVGACNELSGFLKRNSNSLSDDLANEGINFKFIPGYSPHFGGIWESAVKSTKFHLLRVLANSHLTYEELYTVLTQIEAILNSRPLTPLSADPEDMTPLTPGHFLIGRPLTAISTEDYRDCNINKITRFEKIEQLRQHFWSRWSKEYITELQKRTKWQTSSSQPLKIDALVLLKEENLPPMKWRLGRIVALHPGPDNIVRVADIKTSNGIVRRSFSRICILPIMD